MNIRIIFTKSGQIIGDLSENFVGDSIHSITVNNPVLLMSGPQGVQFVPLLMLTTDTKVTLSRDELLFNGESFEPLTEMRNQYSTMFGSGIQLLNK